MNPSESVADGRDPVAFAVEKYLRHVEQEGEHKLSIKQRPDGTRLRFGSQSTDGLTLDIALIRLAALLLGTEPLREGLTKALRGPVAIAAAHRNRAYRHPSVRLRSE